MEGILLIDKPAGVTSFDVIRKVKQSVGKGYKIGHAGTLDPFATGLLVLTFGRYTKMFDAFQKMRKEYEVTAEFGYETDTYDLTGKKVFEDSKPIEITPSKLESSIIPFTGDIMQIPPKFSAKKVNGKRAYDLARENIEFELKPKQVRVYNFSLLSLDGNIAKFLIQCSSGTYIRSLVIDLARSLDTYATCIELRRNYIGEYSVENAMKMEDISFENIKLNLIKA